MMRKQEADKTQKIKVSRAKFNEFIKLVDNPPEDNPALQSLLNIKPVSIVGKVLVKLIDFIHTIVFLSVFIVLYSLFGSIPRREWYLLSLFSLNLLVGRCVLTELENKVRAYFQMPQIKSWLREGQLRQLINRLYNRIF